MSSETLYLFCLKFFETLHPNFCVDKNELDELNKHNDKNIEVSEDTSNDNELLIVDQSPSIQEIIRDEVNLENISLTANEEPDETPFIESISNKSADNEISKKPDYFCNCVKKIGLFLTSKIKKSD
jgi:hypothetical protein